MLNSGAIATLTNKSGGAIRGGASASTATGSVGAILGGAGVANTGTIKTLTNSGLISGGVASAVLGHATGGAGVLNSSNTGMITTLTSSGAISGGDASAAGFRFTHFLGNAAGGAGVSNLGAMTTLTTRGAIAGGAARGSFANATGGAGVSNSGTITTLTNSGMISGGAANARGSGSAVGGAGVSNSGTIAKLINSGMISGSAASSAHGAATPGDAIYSAGKHASIGPITNSGKIIGNVEIDNQASVTISSGSSKTFGSWRGGKITIGAGNLTFASGNTALGDDISVDGGAGTVTNMGALRLAAPETIAGNFTQSAAGVLGLDFAGDALGQYGALTVTKLTTLDGGLSIDLTNGFTLATGDRFDILGFGNLVGNFDTLALDGAACMARPMDSWTCGGVRLREVINATSLDLVVAHASAVLGPVGSSPIPEPSTWAMLALGFLGLGGLRLRKRGRAAAS